MTQHHAARVFITRVFNAVNVDVLAAAKDGGIYVGIKEDGFLIDELMLNASSVYEGHPSDRGKAVPIIPANEPAAHTRHGPTV